MSTGPAAPEKTQGGKRQLKRGRREIGRRTRVAGAAVGFTHSPGAFSWAPWSRGSWPCILSWTRRSRWHCVGRRWFGPSSSGRTSLRLLRHPSRSAAGGDWDPQAPEDPHPPLPPPAPSPPAGLGRGSGPRAATQPGKNRLLSPAGSGTISGTPLPPPQLSPPPPWSAEAGQGKRDRQLQENGGARLLLGAFRAAPGHVTRAPPLLLCLPPLFPSLSSSTQALPRSAREERGGARALRDGTRPAGATGGSPAGAVRGPPRHVTLPANRSPEAGLAGVKGREVGGGARDVWLLPSPPTRVS